MAGSGHERNGHGGVTGETGLQPDAAENEGFHAAAEVLRVPPELVPAVRGHLTELGLIDPGAEIAVDALAALQRLTAEGDVQVGAITELLAARQRLTGTLLRSYPDASISGVDTIPVEVLAPGDPGRLEAVIDGPSMGARVEVLEMHPPADWSRTTLERSRARTRSRIERGVRMRSLHVQSVLVDPVMPEHLRLRAEEGAEIRYAPMVATRMVMYDRRAAMITGGGEGVWAVTVRGEDVAGTLGALHDHLWMNAFSVTDIPHTPQGVTLSAQQQAVLRMLTEGAKDDTGARALGVSTPTVTRVVGELITMLEAGSRFQAGVRAARLGWLD